MAVMAGTLQTEPLQVSNLADAVLKSRRAKAAINSPIIAAQFALSGVSQLAEIGRQA
ncbi:hypothetical protein [Bradyrhizobium sp. JYMT SZCCT0180]|uniref:hypothetical protein n=1 Tax=Bradyrhizobium sp. JYMT SZCCT0180 TaxID=2807666 RepID=UPI001BA55E28|nr:hypothetical protein [Bradyrhizobium sp. JYMT SZCCT0180]MBR1211529.1 hypothetical protein [Bradyrhizobium sp. JYMT SZCCT0180]